MDLSIIIVNWNTRDLLAHCLDAVFANPPAGEFQVIVVDNASIDGSAAMVRERFPQVQLMALDHNPGFAGGNNRAIEIARGRYLLLLNPDTVVQQGAIDSLITFLDGTPAAGAAGSRLLNPDGTLQTSCYPAPTLGRELWRLFHLDALRPLATYPMNEWPVNAPRPVDTVQGASLIIRREVVDCIGPLDESYFMYSEEIDWCLRVRQAGWEIYWVPASQVIHYGGQSTRLVATTMFLQLYRAKLHYFRKHFGAGHGLLYKAELLVASLIRLLLTPLALILQPARRRERATLARYYGRLILSLPQM